MRIKLGEYIHEVDKVWVRTRDICIGTTFYQTGDKTQEIGEQLFKEGYADLTPFKTCL